jgi:hypothetical protein
MYVGFLLVARVAALTGTGGSDLARLVRLGKVMENLPPTAVEREMFMPYGPLIEKVRMSDERLRARSD